MKIYFGVVNMKQYLTVLSATIMLIKQATSLDQECRDLLPGQYRCDDPQIDTKTQAEAGCRKNHTVLVPCRPAPGIQCDGKRFTGKENAFYKEVPCRYVEGKSFEVALLLSIFLGVFGIDRFYLGYPAIGLLKFCTLGFFMIFQLIDVILIATQVLKPADGSDYIVNYYGPRIERILPNKDTYYLPQD